MIRRPSREDAYEEMIRRDFWMTIRRWIAIVLLFALFGIGCAALGAWYERMKQANSEQRN